MEMTVTEYREQKKERAKQLAKHTKADLVDKLLFAYDTIRRLENKRRTLSAGICDTCSIPKMMNTGDGVNEPPDPILYCQKMKREICPEPPEDRMVECLFHTFR